MWLLVGLALLAMLGVIIWAGIEASHDGGGEVDVDGRFGGASPRGLEVSRRDADHLADAVDS